MSRGEAELLLDSQLLKDTFAWLEADALERAVNALPSDDETRRVCTMQVRALRSVREHLEALLRDTDTPTPDPVV